MNVKCPKPSTEYSLWFQVVKCVWSCKWMSPQLMGKKETIPSDHTEALNIHQINMNKKLCVPWNGCSWTQHTCGQQTAGNHKHLFRSVKEKILWNLHLLATSQTTLHLFGGYVWYVKWFVVFPQKKHTGRGDLQINLCSRTLWMSLWPHCGGRLSLGTCVDIHDLWWWVGGGKWIMMYNTVELNI